MGPDETTLVFLSVYFVILLSGMDIQGEHKIVSCLYSGNTDGGRGAKVVGNYVSGKELLLGGI